jgi:hypothetical protein
MDGAGTDQVRSLRELFASVSDPGGHGVGDPTALLAAGGHGDLPGDLMAEAVVNYADTAPLEVAQHLAPFVMAHSAVPGAAEAAHWSGDDAGPDIGEAFALLSTAPHAPDADHPFDPGLDHAGVEHLVLPDGGAHVAPDPQHDVPDLAHELAAEHPDLDHLQFEHHVGEHTGFVHSTADGAGLDDLGLDHAGAVAGHTWETGHAWETGVDHLVDQPLFHDGGEGADLGFGHGGPEILAAHLAAGDVFDLQLPHAVSAAEDAGWLSSDDAAQHLTDFAPEHVDEWADTPEHHLDHAQDAGIHPLPIDDAPGHDVPLDPGHGV